MMSLRTHIALMAQYHGWATAQLYRQVDALDDEMYRRPTGLFFTSIHGTLNHLLVADSIWHGRLTDDPFAVTSVAQVVEDDRDQLRARLLARGQVWEQYLGTLDDAALGGDQHYRMLDGSPRRIPRASCMLHVFNHGTHHRGQISTALTQLGLPAPEMDFPYYLYSLPEYAPAR